MSGNSEGISVVKHVHEGVTRYYGSANTVSVVLESKFMDFEQFVQGAGTRDKCITALRAEVGEDDDLSSLTIQVGIKARLNDEPTWYGPFSLEDGDDLIHTLDVQDGRYVAFRIEDLFPRSVWSMYALEIFGTINEGRQ